LLDELLVRVHIERRSLIPVLQDSNQTLENFKTTSRGMLWWNFFNDFVAFVQVWFFGKDLVEYFCFLNLSDILIDSVAGVLQPERLVVCTRIKKRCSNVVKDLAWDE